MSRNISKLNRKKKSKFSPLLRDDKEFYKGISVFAPDEKTKKQKQVERFIDKSEIIRTGTVTKKGEKLIKQELEQERQALMRFVEDGSHIFRTAEVTEKGKKVIEQQLKQEKIALEKFIDKGEITRSGTVTQKEKKELIKTDKVNSK